MRFKNLKSGNMVSSNDAGTIALMKKSPNYEEIPEKKAKGKPEGKSEGKSEE